MENSRCQCSEADFERGHNEQGQNMNECFTGVGKVKGVEFPRKYCPDRCHNHSEVSASGLQSPTILVGKYLEVAQTSKLIPYKALFTKY